jgi:hypothetical protein
VQADSQSPPVAQFESSDVEIMSHLSRFHPSYEFEECDNEWLCMALASETISHPVAAHGHGDSKVAAHRMASLNLIHNIHHLFPIY